MPRHAASSKGLRGSSVWREAGDGAPVDVRGVMPLTVAALAVSSRAAISTWSQARSVSPRTSCAGGEREFTSDQARAEQAP